MTRGSARLCLLFNLVLPGVGSFFARRLRTAIVQSVLSLIGFAMLIPAFVKFYGFVQTYTEGLQDGDIDAVLNNSEMFKGMWERLKVPIIVGIVGFVILKISWLWAQVTTAGAFKAAKQAEAEEEKAAAARE